MQDNTTHVIGTIKNNLVSLRGKSAKVEADLQSLDVGIDAMAACLKKKALYVGNNLAGLNGEIEKVDAKFEKLLVEIEVYKARLDRELGAKVRRLERELEEAKKGFTAPLIQEEQVDQDALRVASTVSILECLLRSICGGADDFRLASYAFLFPAVFERVVSGNEEAYLLDSMPVSAPMVVQRGREYLDWVRSECNTHITDPEAWDRFSKPVTDWWRNDALPLLYGARDEQWDSDEPMALVEVLSWRDDPASRPINFSPIWDAYEIYTKHKDEVYESSGVRSFEVKVFSFPGNPQ